MSVHFVARLVFVQCGKTNGQRTDCHLSLCAVDSFSRASIRTIQSHYGYSKVNDGHRTGLRALVHAGAKRYEAGFEAEGETTCVFSPPRWGSRPTRS